MKPYDKYVQAHNMIGEVRSEVEEIVVTFFHSRNTHVDIKGSLVLVIYDGPPMNSGMLDLINQRLVEKTGFQWIEIRHYPS